MINQSSTQKSQISLWDQLVADDGLDAGWARVAANGGSAGGDDETLGQFAAYAPDRLAGLTRDLRAGRYAPGPCRHVLIPKKRGGTRPLDIPCVSDRVVQTAVSLLILPMMEAEFEPQSYAYRPGKGVTQAVAAMLSARRDGYVWTAEGDIEHCFEAIPHAPLLKTFDDVVGDARLTELLRRWMVAFAPGGVGIPQGSPISPMLCNLHLDAVDEAMQGHGVRFVRFADDFVMMTKSASAAEAALERIAVQLDALGLSLNPEKTRIVAIDQSLHFLGHVFVRSMAVKAIGEAEAATPIPDAPREEEIAAALDAIEAVRPLPETAHAAEAITSDVGRLSARQRTLYVLTPGMVLTRHKDLFVAVEEAAGAAAETRMHIHPDRISRIEIGPGGSADWEALALAADKDIVVARVDGWGQTKAVQTGSLDPRASLVAAQAMALADPVRRMAIGRAIIDGRIRNQRAMVSRLNRPRKDSRLRAAGDVLGRWIGKVERAETIDSARGCEGNASRIYWNAFGKCFDLHWGYAGGRGRQPPPDPINACLSYLSALLERDMRVAVRRVGLHPGIGFVHVPRDDRGADALVYDLMEAFRAPLVEALVNAMVQRRILRPEMFVRKGDGIRIEAAGIKALIRGWEAWVRRPVDDVRSARDPATGRRRQILWHWAMEEDARALARDLRGGEGFRPWPLDY